MNRVKDLDNVDDAPQEISKTVHTVTSLSSTSSPQNTTLTSSVLSLSDELLRIELELCYQLKRITFSFPVAYVYSPIEYAFNLHAQFVRKFCNTHKKVLFVGMNPGPWGMSQTGVPFGEVSVVRDWLGLHGSIDKPQPEHPSRKITGLNCHRSEVSGKRFWGLFQDICGPGPQVFFQNCFIYNHCPFALMTDSAKNVTPAELKASESKLMLSLCDQTLAKVLSLLQVETVVAIGKFAEKRSALTIKSVGLDNAIKVVSIPHPSPRNASGSQNWKEVVTKKLEDLGFSSLFQTSESTP